MTNSIKADERKQPVDPCVVVVFGASGDLTKRKLVPAFYNLKVAGKLPDDFSIIGVSRTSMTDQEFQKHFSDELHDFIPKGVDEEKWAWLMTRIHYLPGDISNPELYKDLKSRLEKIAPSGAGKQNYLFYLATQPSFFSSIVTSLHEAELLKEDTGWRKVIIEKPFGHDLQSAHELNGDILQCLAEHQIYRIDHYLGKETVQNLMVFRFANGIFEPIWNQSYIDHIQITVAETVGVEHRAPYYEAAGAMRDMVSNHILQLMALTMMEPPSSLEADAIRDEKTKLLRSVKPLTNEDVNTNVVGGQYTSGQKGTTDVPGYREEPNVNSKSQTETYVALKLTVENWRWSGVPVYIRTGKRLKKRVTEIAIQFKRAPAQLFKDAQAGAIAPNVLVIRIQPDEGISLRFGVKEPGLSYEIRSVDMDFFYDKVFKNAPTTGYETLLHDCMRGDPTLFQRADTVEESWSIVEPILKQWPFKDGSLLHPYKAGSQGPQEAEDLIKRDGRVWRAIE